MWRVIEDHPARSPAGRHLEAMLVHMRDQGGGWWNGLLAIDVRAPGRRPRLTEVMEPVPSLVNNVHQPFLNSMGWRPVPENRTEFRFVKLVGQGTWEGRQHTQWPGAQQPPPGAVPAEEADHLAYDLNVWYG